MAATSKFDAAGGTPDRPGTLLDRVRRAQRIALLRAEGKTWRQVSQAVGLSIKAAQVAHNDYLSWDVDVPDVMATVDRSIAIRSAAIDRLDEIAHTGDNASAQVGAIRAMLDADRERIELWQAAGRLPRNLARFRAEVEFVELARQMVGLLRNRGIDPAVLDELRELTARSLPQASSRVSELRPREGNGRASPGERHARPAIARAATRCVGRLPGLCTP